MLRDQDMADGTIDDPALKEKVDAMTAVPPSKPLLPDASSQDAAKPPEKKKKGLGAFGILKMAKKKKKKDTANPATEAEPTPRRGTTADVGTMQRKMKLEMCLKDLQRTVRLKKSRDILRSAFKNDKEGGFDEAWQKMILAPILERNSFSLESLGKAFDEFRRDQDISALRASYEKAMARFRHLIMTESH